MKLKININSEYLEYMLNLFYQGYFVESYENITRAEIGFHNALYLLIGLNAESLKQLKKFKSKDV